MFGVVLMMTLGDGVRRGGQVRRKQRRGQGGSGWRRGMYIKTRNLNVYMNTQQFILCIFHLRSLVFFLGEDLECLVAMRFHNMSCTYLFKTAKSNNYQRRKLSHIEGWMDINASTATSI